MTEILQTNIFFIITSVAVVVFTIFLCVAMYYIIKILRTVRSIIERIDASSEAVAEDISQLRSYVASGSLISQIVGLFFKTRGKKKKD